MKLKNNVPVIIKAKSIKNSINKRDRVVCVTSTTLHIQWAI